MKAVKILAIGYKRFMWLRMKDKLFCIRIDDKLYQMLKNKGVPTCQSLRKKHGR